MSYVGKEVLPPIFIPKSGHILSHNLGVFSESMDEIWPWAVLIIQNLLLIPFLFQIIRVTFVCKCL